MTPRNFNAQVNILYQFSLIINPGLITINNWTQIFIDGKMADVLEGSSNGRTADSESVCGGSNPSPSAKHAGISGVFFLHKMSLPLISDQIAAVNSRAIYAPKSNDHSRFSFLI